MTSQQLIGQYIKKGVLMEIRNISKLLYQLKLVNQEMVTTFEKKTGFSITRYEILMFLQEHESCTQTDLQNALHIDRAAITRHLKILEEKNYISRQRNTQNNREVSVKMTDLAKTQLHNCEKRQSNTAENLKIKLNVTEREQLITLLTKLIQ